MPTTLITGANRGVGLALAGAYAGDGWRVIATCRRPEDADALHALAAASDGRVSVLPCDVTDNGSVADLARALTGRAIDLLVNNAGVWGGRKQDLPDLDLSDWDRAFAVNTLGPLRVATALVENVAASERRLIVTLSSRMGSIGENGSASKIAYRASKAALNQVVKCLANAWGPRGLTCVVMHPGWVRTDMGGPSATLTPAESVAGLRQVIAGLTTADNGRFLNHDGGEIPW